MFEQHLFRCPNCKTEIRQKLTDSETLSCISCKKSFNIMIDEKSKKTAFVEVVDKIIPEPLYLPKGSIRAITTICLAISSWILIFRGENVPDYMFSLLLAVIGYYFGFRKKLKSADSRIHDASAQKLEPLFLPEGIIRWILFAGFIITGILLWKTGRLLEIKYISFYVIMGGLIIGYLFAKLTSFAKNTDLYVFMNHLKGLAVIITSAAITYIMLSGQNYDGNYTALTLCSIISFYFGSRS